MVNFNGTLVSPQDPLLHVENRGFRYGDSLFETFRTLKGKPIFWEDHYLRLMASMRIMRMEIPMEFTLENLEAEIAKVLHENALEDTAARVRLTVYRKGKGLYLPQERGVSFLIEVSAMAMDQYHWNGGPYEIELFKDNYIGASLLSTLKTNNRALNVIGSIYAEENGYQNCLLVNQSKNVVEALNGNVFVLMGTTLKTPPKSEGCINGIMRKKLMELCKNREGVVLEEAPISPFELQRADEVFITNSIVGIQPVTRYRKKAYATQLGEALLGELNNLVEEKG